MIKHLKFLDIAKRYGNILCHEFITDNKAFDLLKRDDGEFTFKDTSAHNEEKQLVNYLLSNGLCDEDFIIK